ncbi:hypothetical protein PHYSODRAFT_286030, partial [Phytophthora sojae]
RDLLDSPTVASLGELLATKTLVAAGDKERGEDDFRGHCRHAGHRGRAAGDQGRAGPEDHGPVDELPKPKGVQGPTTVAELLDPKTMAPVDELPKAKGTVKLLYTKCVKRGTPVAELWYICV